MQVDTAAQKCSNKMQR